MLSMLLAVIAGVLVGRWLGVAQTPKPAYLKVRVGDLRRRVHGRR